MKIRVDMNLSPEWCDTLRNHGWECEPLVQRGRSKGASPWSRINLIHLSTNLGCAICSVDVTAAHENYILDH